MKGESREEAEEKDKKFRTASGGRGQLEKEGRRGRREIVSGDDAAVLLSHFGSHRYISMYSI